MKAAERLVEYGHLREGGYATGGFVVAEAFRRKFLQVTDSLQSKALRLQSAPTVSRHLKQFAPKDNTMSNKTALVLTADEKAQSPVFGVHEVN